MTLYYCKCTVLPVYILLNRISYIITYLTPYGSTLYRGPHGQLHYSVNDVALQSLKEGVESFLERMWEQLMTMTIVRNSRTNTITLRHVQLWKRITDFKLRFKKNDLSLCKLFKSV